MSSSYAGDSTAFPISFLIPSDGDAENASSINVALEALGDRTAQLNARALKLDLIRVLNFGPSAALSNVVHAVWSEPEQRWYACGGTDNVVSSKSGGWTWDAATLIPGPQLGTLTCKAIAVDTAGNLVVVASGTASLYEYNKATATWTKRAAGFATDSSEPNIHYDPINALWCSLYEHGASNTFEAKTSPDRITWTTRTVAITGAPITGVNQCREGVDPTHGVLVGLFGPTAVGDANQTVRVSRSTDGGVTWTQQANVAIGFSMTVTPRPVYNVLENVWLFAAHNATTSASKIFKSTDGGVTWTQVASLTTQAISRLVADDHTWAGVTAAGAIVFSTDQGSTWSFANTAVTTPHNGIFKSSAGLLVLGPTEMWPSLRTGPAGALLT